MLKPLALLAFFCLQTYAWASAERPLAERSAAEIMNNYSIIGDFNIKPEIRSNSDEIFWRYPVKLPKAEFRLVFPDLVEERNFFPATDGGGRRYEHLNIGRQLILRGDFEKARKVLLGGKARFGTSYEFHRRTDFFIANAFLKLGEQALEKNKGQFDHQDVRTQLVNASTFLSWAYGVKQNIPDLLLDRVAPRYYYNLAAIYFRYENWSGSFGAVKDGLDFLMRNGRKDFRGELRRMQAEMYIRNRDYLQAAQELDIALQQDQSTANVGAIFARIGDIYFDLNNFELAEEMYHLAIKLDQHHKTIKPWHYILRGESLFWLGRFQEAQRMMHYGLELASSLDVVSDLSFDLQALASIRIADSWLALKRYEKAKLAYFQHYSNFRKHDTGQVARLREACLELPFYQGNNIAHARSLLDQIKKEAANLPPVGEELAWTCELASYAQHERSPELIDRVRQFYRKFPRSEFLKQVVEPVVEVQAAKIYEYFARQDIYGAIDFFEKNKASLFKRIEPKLRSLLFSAYAATFQDQKAEEFLADAPLIELEDNLRAAAVMSALADKKASYSKKNQKIAEKINSLQPNFAFDELTLLLVDRVLNGSGSNVHLPWIYTFAKRWSSEDFEKTCDLLYPVLRRVHDLDKQKNARTTKKKVALFVKDHLADLLRYKSNCALSVLEFEFDTFYDQPRYLADRYLERDFLPMNKLTEGLIFAVAEQNAESGMESLARLLWKKLVDRGNPDSVNVRFAKTRLDRTKMQTEMLWDN